MRKLLLLITALLTLGVSGAWAKTQLAYNTLTTGVDYVLADNGQSWFLAQSGKTGCIIENNKYQLVAADVAGHYDSWSQVGSQQGDGVLFTVDVSLNLALQVIAHPLRPHVVSEVLERILDDACFVPGPRPLENRECTKPEKVGTGEGDLPA